MVAEHIVINVTAGEPVDVPSSESLPPDWGDGTATPPAAGAGQMAGGSDSPEAPLVPVEAVAGAVRAGFDAIAARRGEHWRLEAGEELAIAEPLAGELSELAVHAPFLGGALAAVGGRRMQLLTAIGLTVGPRLVVDVQLGRERAREQTSRLTVVPRTSASAPAPNGNGHTPNGLPDATIQPPPGERWGDLIRPSEGDY